MPGFLRGFAALSLVWGCGGSSAPSDAATAPDAALADGAMDARPDAGGPADAGADATPDAHADVGPDASPDAGPTSCPPVPRCDGPPPDPGSAEPWRHPVRTAIATATGAPRHRGQDLFVGEGEDVWALAKFAYGFGDDDLKDEDVEVWLDEGCTGSWTSLGRVATTEDGDHGTVLGVEDTGGWVFLRHGPLPVGRHRLHFVVRGDLSTADQWVQVLPAGARVVVTDVDGTLTESETAEWRTLLSGPSPAVQPGAPEALTALAERGYFLFYLTARPHWLHARTHEWIAERDLPPGVVHTTLGFTGALGSAALDFKVGELADLADRLGIVPTYAIGNKESDAEAFQTAGVAPERRLLYQLDGNLFGGVRFDDYGTLADEFRSLPPVCL